MHGIRDKIVIVAVNETRSFQFPNWFTKMKRFTKSYSEFDVSYTRTPRIIYFFMLYLNIAQ